MGVLGHKLRPPGTDPRARGEQAGGRALSRELFAPLGMRQTRANPNAEVPAPALHGYEAQRGVYEDATNWSPSWVPGVAYVTSAVADLGRWVRSYRSDLSARSGR